MIARNAKTMEDLMEKIISLCKRRGFIFQSSEIYGGINGFWDYGPLGAHLKWNIRQLWWEEMTRREDIVPIDASIIMHPTVWKASGHVDTFVDMMVDCKLCKCRFRADQLHEIPCPRNSRISAAECEGEKTQPRPFNLMFKTVVGPIESEENIAYLRPETAQAIFVQFKNILETSRQKIPFGICQIGKAFRNEVTPRNFIFRSREFEQMELEYFIRPDEVTEKIYGHVIKPEQVTDWDKPQKEWGWQTWHIYWVKQRRKWYERIGLPSESIEEYWQKPEELAHYAKATVDLLFKFPFGTQELEGIAARGDFDLKAHQTASGKSMEYFDDEAKCKYIPHVIEPSAGVDRIFLAILCSAYEEEEIFGENGEKDIRIVLRLHPRVAPIKVGVFPLLKNRAELVEKAREVYRILAKELIAFYDDSGAIGRRYRRQDEIGTPFCVTIDFDTIGTDIQLKDTVTVRDRDTMKQIRVKIPELLPFLQEKLKNYR